MTHLYLAYGSTSNPILAAWDWQAKPLNVLIALPYLQAWSSLVASAPSVNPERRMLDSGAFSAWKSGKTIDIDQLITESKKPYWTEAVGLDVIGSAAGSVANMTRMRTAGSRAMPVFHIGDPWEHFDYYTAHWSKIGLSCRFGEPVKESLRFYDQCFARRYPFKYHSFGWIGTLGNTTHGGDVLFRYPFHSGDASTWTLAATAFRNLQVKGRQVKSLGRGLEFSTVVGYLNVHVEDHLRHQAALKSHWRRDMQLLDALP